MPALHQRSSAVSKRVFFVSLLLSPFSSWAADIPCRDLLDELSNKQEGSPAYEISLRDAMDPAVLTKLERVGPTGQTTEAMATKIHSLYFDVFVQECQQNPMVYTYATSRLAGQQTRNLVQDYFNLGN